MSTIQPRLQYNYAKIDLSTGECKFCRTYSYSIPLPEYIPVPRPSDDYIGKFYNQQDGLWYHDAQFTQIFDTSYLNN